MGNKLREIRKQWESAGYEAAPQKSIGQQLLGNSWIGRWLYGEPTTYKDGNDQERKDASFKDSANGQLVQRMGETAKDTGNLVATGLAFGNPLTASNVMAPLIVGSQAYWVGHGINDGAQRIENIGEGVKNFVEDPSWQAAAEMTKEVPMLVLDAASAAPVAKTIITTAKQVTPTIKKIAATAAKAVDYVKDQRTINQAFRTGQLRFGEPTSYTAYHQSFTPITKFKFPFKRWDVKTHGADPNGVFFTVGGPAGAGFLAERPYTGMFHIKTKKPLIQTGEMTGTTKNNLRNAIVKRARKDGADAVFFDGIADNRLQNQRILMAFDNSDIKFIGGPGKVKYFGPTMGKTTLVKTNNNYIDLDQLIKPLRKQIADKLGLKVSDPKVAKSPEYQTALKQLIEEFQTNNSNNGKILMGSQKQLLNGDFVLDGEPMLPDFETFVARNQARNFRETPEQLRVWYDEILGLKPDIKIDNRYVSEILNK